ncbi:MAG: divalent-cation tolerance protein CutA [Actinoplanes sp.]
MIEEGLCAGSHLTEIRSVYRWQGEIVDKPEARLALHTRASLVPEITAFVAERHPYQVPCVVAWPISDGNPEYLAWIISETREPQPAGWLTCRRRPSASRSPGLPPPSSRRSGSAGSAS